MATRISTSQEKDTALHETQVLTLESFKKALGDSVVAYFRERSPTLAWHYEVDNEVDLKEMDSTDVEKLFLGKPFEVMDQWSESNSDYFYQQDASAVRTELIDQLRGKFKADLEALAEVIDMDPDDLKEEILEDEELSHSHLDLYLHFNNDVFRGAKAANAHLGDYRLDPQSGAELFEMLERLRITAADFLAKAIGSIEASVHDDGQLGREDQKAWGLDRVYTDIENAHGWTEAYRKLFNAELEKFTARTGVTLTGFNEPSAADADDLITMALDSHGVADLYVHMTMDKDTIENFSIPAGRHDFAQEPDFETRICSGYISTNGEPGESDEASTELLSPLNVRTQLVSVLNHSPERDESDVIRLIPSQELYADLYEIVSPRMQARWNHKDKTELSATLDDNDPEDAECLQKCLKRMKDAPHWACTLAVSRINLLQTDGVHSFLKQLKASTEPHLQSVNTELVSRIRAYQAKTTAVDKAAALAKVEEILPFVVDGNDKDAKDENGLRAFDWSIRCGLPLEVTKRLSSPRALEEIQTDHSVSIQHPLYGAVIRLKNVQSGSKNEESLADCSETIHWLLAHGSFVPSSLSTYVHDNVFEDLLQTESPRVVHSIIQKFADQCPSANYQEIVNSLLRRSCVKASPDLARVFLDAGADPDVANCEMVIESEKKRQNLGWSIGQKKMERLNDLSDMLRSYRAKKIALEAIGGLEPNRRLPQNASFRWPQQSIKKME